MAMEMPMHHHGKMEHNVPKAASILDSQEVSAIIGQHRAALKTRELEWRGECLSTPIGMH